MSCCNKNAVKNVYEGCIFYTGNAFRGVMILTKSLAFQNFCCARTNKQRKQVDLTLLITRTKCNFTYSMPRKTSSISFLVF